MALAGCAGGGAPLRSEALPSTAGRSRGAGGDGRARSVPPGAGRAAAGTSAAPSARRGAWGLVAAGRERVTGASSPADTAAAGGTATGTATGSGATGAAATGPSDGTGSAEDAAASATVGAATGADCDTAEAATTMDVWVVCQYCHPNHDTTASSMPPSKAATRRRIRAWGLGAADGAAAPTMACAAWRAEPVIGSRAGAGAWAGSARGGAADKGGAEAATLPAAGAGAGGAVASSGAGSSVGVRVSGRFSLRCRASSSRLTAGSSRPARRVAGSGCARAWAAALRSDGVPGPGSRP